MQEERDVDHEDVEEEEEGENGESPRAQHQQRNGDVPVRMYRSVVLTSVRQFTDPGSPTSQKTCLELPASPTLTEDMDPRDLLAIDAEPEEQDLGRDEDMESADAAAVDTCGYFNAAFEDFDDQEKEAYEEERSSPGRIGLEVIRGNVMDFNEEEEENIESSSTSSSSSSSSSSSESCSETSGSVRHLAGHIDDKIHPYRELEPLHVEDSYVVEVKASQLPSPEVPSMEILNSRPITPEDFLTPEGEDWKSPQESVGERVQQEDSAAIDHDEVTDENRSTLERVMLERFSFEQTPSAAQDRSDSPIMTNTPPPTPAVNELNVFYQAFAGASLKVDVEPVEDNQLEEVVEDPIVDDAGVIISRDDSVESIAESIDDEKEAIVNECPLDQNPSPPEADSMLDSAGSILLAAIETREEETHDPAQRAQSSTSNSVRATRKISRDEGTQTEFCGYTGRLHVTPPVQSTEITSIIEPQTIPLQVEESSVEMATSTSDMEAEKVEDQPATLQEIDAQLDRLVVSMESAQEEVASPVSDGEVFIAIATAADPKANEDVDSFYGSDKEIDGEVVFSHTDSSPSSSSSSDSDVEPERKPQQVSIYNSSLFCCLATN